MLGKQQEGQHVCIRVRGNHNGGRWGGWGVARQVTKGLVSHYKVSPFYKLALRPQGSQPLATPLDLLGPLVGTSGQGFLPSLFCQMEAMVLSQEWLPFVLALNLAA